MIIPPTPSTSPQIRRHRRGTSAWATGREASRSGWEGRTPAGRGAAGVAATQEHHPQPGLVARLVAPSMARLSLDAQGEFYRRCCRTRPARRAHRSYACWRQFVAQRVPIRASLIAISRIRKRRGQITFRKNSKKSCGVDEGTPGWQIGSVRRGGSTRGCSSSPADALGPWGGTCCCLHPNRMCREAGVKMFGGMPPQITVSSASLVSPGRASIVELTTVGSTTSLAWSSRGRSGVPAAPRRRNR